MELRKQDAMRITAPVIMATRMNGLEHYFFLSIVIRRFLKGLSCLFRTNILIPEIPTAMREEIKK